MSEERYARTIQRSGHTCCKICNVLTTFCILIQFTPTFSAKVTSLCSAIPRFLIFALSILAGKCRCYEFGAKIQSFLRLWYLFVRRLHQHLQSCFPSQLEAKIIVKNGPPGQEICKVAKEEEAIFIVMGSRGAGTVRRTILGSVSDYVIHHADMPVIVVPRVQKQTILTPPLW